MDPITSVTAEQLTRALADTAYLAMSPPKYFAKHMKKWTTDDLFSGIRIPFEVLDARKFETHPVFVSLIANQVAAE